MPQIFGISSETESSWPDALSEAHRDFILAYIEMEQTREEAVVRQFLAARDPRKAGSFRIFKRQTATSLEPMAAGQV